MDFRTLSEELRQLVADAHVPSLAIAVMHQDEVVYSEGFGLTSVEPGGIPVTPETLFRIGSTTKPMVGFAIMQLVEQGKLNLDAPITRYVPWVRFRNRDGASAVTLRMLLSHTSGLPTEYRANGSSDPAMLEESLRRELPNYRLFSLPGRLWSYSNPGVRLAAHIAERASGTLVPELLQELVFAPLGIRCATCNPLQAMSFPLALPHKEGEDGQLQVMRPFMNNAERYPAGGVITNVLEVIRFGQALIGAAMGEGGEVLSPRSAHELWRPHARRLNAFDDFYGLTIESVHRLGPGWIGHSGYAPPYRSRFAVHPESQTVISMLFVENRAFAETSWSPLQKLANELAPPPSDTTQAEKLHPPTSWLEVAGEYIDRQGRVANIEYEAAEPALLWEGCRFALLQRHQSIFMATSESAASPVVLGIPNYPGNRADFITIDCLTFRRVSRLTKFWQNIQNRCAAWGSSNEV